MSTDPSPLPISQAQAPVPPPKSKVPWPLLLFLFILALLVANRCYYLAHFGFIYTDGDQTAFWYQADDVAHGIFREPCLYGQNYNVPIEAWLAAPFLLLHIPAYIALPAVAAALGLLPFLVLSLLAYRHKQRWAASIILLIPLALPIEFTVISSLPRGFINGLAVATPALACWLFYRSRTAFFLGAFFAVLALTVNPNCSIVLLAAGTFALLTHIRSVKFYLLSFLGALAALPAPFFLWLFYKYHPQCDAYHPKAPIHFTWQLLRNTIFVPDQSTLSLNRPALDIFFADFIPIAHQGWLMLCILPALVLLLLLVSRPKAAVAILLASIFTILCLGIERIHAGYENVFYPTSRMFLALPILIAIALLWFDLGLGDRRKKFRVLIPVVRALLILGLATLAGFSFFGNINLLGSPSPLVLPFTVPPVENVQELIADSHLVAAACQKYNADLVLIGENYLTTMDNSGPVLTNHAFETLSPFFERRTYRIKEERTRLHTRVILYMPSGLQTFLALNSFNRSRLFHATVISDSPKMLLIETTPPGLPGLTIATNEGIIYREKF